MLLKEWADAPGQFAQGVQLLNTGNLLTDMTLVRNILKRNDQLRMGALPADGDKGSRDMPGGPLSVQKIEGNRSIRKSFYG